MVQEKGRGEPEWGGVVADIRRTATGRGRSALRCYSIEGTRVHERVLRAGATVERAVTTEKFLQDPDPRTRDLFEALEQGACRVVTVPDAVMDDLTAGRSIGRIVGLVRLPVPPTMRSVLEHAPLPRVLVVGMAVDDPGNVGALVRTCLASGAAAYVAVGPGDPFHPRAVRTSMGSIVKVPVLRYASVDALLGDLDETGVRKVGAVSRGGTRLDEICLGGDPVAVFLGSEAQGLSESTLAAMDVLVTIPMRSGVDSFSVNAAAAVILYEVKRGVTS